LFNCREPGVFISALAFIHDMQYLIDEAIETDESSRLLGAPKGGEQLGGAFFPQFRCVHVELCLERSRASDEGNKIGIWNSSLFNPPPPLRLAEAVPIQHR
jgi:hypothetical protein